MIVKLLRGEPTVAHFAAPSNVVPGQIVVVNTVPFIAVHAAASGDIAAFACGGGVYEATASETSGDEPTAGNKAYFNSSDDAIGDVTITGQLIGLCTYVSGDVCHFYHAPDGTTVA